jgi:hypothetical protein
MTSIAAEAAARRRRRTPRRLARRRAATATAAYNLNDIRSLKASLKGVDLMRTGWGIYVALAGSVSLLLASIRIRLSR